MATVASNAAQIQAQAALIADLTERLGQATEAVAEAKEEAAAATQLTSENARDMDVAWLVICGALVFFMQAGFSMLEAGAVGKKNVMNILFKNLIDACCAAMAFWLLGYGFAYGDTAGGFIGTTNFGSDLIYNNAGEGGSDGWVSWFFQWAFAGTAATIVSGSVAERTKLEVYIIFSLVLTAFIYPVVVHWGWGQGFLSAWGAMPDEDGVAHPLLSGDETSNGMIDFAGSGVVHMVGGWCGLVGAVVVGPRINRFSAGGKAAYVAGSNNALMALGTFILWFGWYGFNCGSTLMISANAGNVAGKVAMTTTISAASSGLTVVLLAKYAGLTSHFDLGMGLNGILGGLVSITAGCSVVDPWMAFLIGMVGGTAYYLTHYLLLRLHIDDPLDAFPIHGACGFWGVLAVGIFCTDANVAYAAYPNTNDACARGEQFGVQLIGALCITAWSVLTASIVMLAMKYTVGMRVTEEIEIQGLDVSEHEWFGAMKDVFKQRIGSMDSSLKPPASPGAAGAPPSGNAVHAWPNDEENKN